MDRYFILAVLILLLLITLRMIAYEAFKLFLIKKSNELIRQGHAIFALQERTDFNLSCKIHVNGKWTSLEYYNYLSAIRHIIEASDILLEPMANEDIKRDFRFMTITEELKEVKAEAIEILENYSKEDAVNA